MEKKNQENNGEADVAYIYQMNWFPSARSMTSHTIMYFLYEKDTRWGHNWIEGTNGSQRCEIRVIKVKTDSNEYESAVKNSSQHKE
jgi:hypothetical protein